MATTAFGQNQRLKQLEDCLQKQGYEITYSQQNMSGGRGITHNWTFGFGARGEEITNRLVYRVPDSIVVLRRQQLAIAIDSIRAAFADLSKEGVESHQYDKHDGCADTIEYSVGFFDGKRNLQPSNNNNRVYFFNAKEQASFSYAILLSFGGV